MSISTLVLSNDPMTKFGHDSFNFAKMFTLAINANRENVAFFDNVWLPSNLKSLKSSKIPIYNTFASLLSVVRVFFPIFKGRVFTSLFFFQLKDVCIFNYKLYFRLATLPHYVNSSPSSQNRFVSFLSKRNKKIEISK